MLPELSSQATNGFGGLPATMSIEKMVRLTRLTRRQALVGSSTAVGAALLAGCKMDSRTEPLQSPVLPGPPGEAQRSRVLERNVERIVDGAAHDRRRRRAPQSRARRRRAVDARSVPPPRRVPVRRPQRLRRRLPRSPASRLRDRDVHDRRRDGAQGQRRQPRAPRPGQRAVDDRGPRHRALGDAEAGARPDVGLPALGEPARARTR